MLDSSYSYIQHNETSLITSGLQCSRAVNKTESTALAALTEGDLE